MKFASHARGALVAAIATLLSGCYYPPPAVMQQSYPFDRHPGVFMEVWWQSDYYGNSYASTRLVNRSNMDKCAWTDMQPSRLLRVGESWQIGQGPSPGNVGVANVLPWDPNCVKAREGS
ncbi:hypothetical protein GCM10028796_53660 [Ramlibacter monticola]|uniref:Lipoprotein n=1 Tax=Ramlibacter monticola TaxID=1926872 RepID=A0A936Z1C4_9BURK|nr:hypothetical protein [Ramlibacter monticola]MBL0391747.1 hypothetical protein [Ramlibacter monticola]